MAQNVRSAHSLHGALRSRTECPGACAIGLSFADAFLPSTALPAAVTSSLKLVVFAARRVALREWMPHSPAAPRLPAAVYVYTPQRRQPNV